MCRITTDKESDCYTSRLQIIDSVFPMKKSRWGDFMTSSEVKNWLTINRTFLSIFVPFSATILHKSKQLFFSDFVNCHCLLAGRTLWNRIISRWFIIYSYDIGWMDMWELDTYLVYMTDVRYWRSQIKTTNLGAPLFKTGSRKNRYL